MANTYKNIDQLASESLSIPEEKILSYLFNINLSVEERQIIDDLLLNNDLFKDRLEGYKIIIQQKNIQTVDQFLIEQEVLTSRFMNNFFAKDNGDKIQSLADEAQEHPKKDEVEPVTKRVHKLEIILREERRILDDKLNEEEKKLMDTVQSFPFYRLIVLYKAVEKRFVQTGTMRIGKKTLLISDDFAIIEILTANVKAFSKGSVRDHLRILDVKGIVDKNTDVIIDRGNNFYFRIKCSIENLIEKECKSANLDFYALTKLPLSKIRTVINQNNKKHTYNL